MGVNGFGGSLSNAFVTVDGVAVELVFTCLFCSTRTGMLSCEAVLEKRRLTAGFMDDVLSSFCAGAPAFMNGIGDKCTCVESSDTCCSVSIVAKCPGIGSSNCSLSSSTGFLRGLFGGEGDRALSDGSVDIQATGGGTGASGNSGSGDLGFSSTKSKKEVEFHCP